MRRSIEDRTERCVREIALSMPLATAGIVARFVRPLYFRASRPSLEFGLRHNKDQGRAMSSYSVAAKPRTRLSLFQRSLVQDEETPLDSLLTDVQIADVFVEYGTSFGVDEVAVYAPAFTLWGLLSQLFFEAEQRSCLAAVVRIAALWLASERNVL